MQGRAKWKRGINQDNLLRGIYTAANEKAQGIYRALSAFLAKVASASQLGGERRRQLIIAYGLRKYGIVRRLFSPLIGRQATLPLR